MGSIDLEKFEALRDAGYLTVQSHAHLPLLIHNYTTKAQYERYWVDETMMARGLVTDLDGRIVARPFGKFFNLDEHIGLFGSLPVEPFEVYEKMDGSLGILFLYEGTPILATRGSFQSVQAKRATQILQSQLAELSLQEGVTYLTEIIYPENRIVVNYGDRTELVLLAMRETVSGRELPLDERVGLPLVKRFDGIRDLNELKQLDDTNQEGFVIRFHSGLRVKLKFDEYVRLHRLVTGISPKSVWEQLRVGSGLEAWLDNVPDEFYQWVRKMEADLWQAYRDIEAKARSEFRHFDDRKEAAAYFLGETTYPHILFKMLDGKSYADVIWKMIEPKGDPHGFVSDPDS